MKTTFMHIFSFFILMILVLPYQSQAQTKGKKYKDFYQKVNKPDSKPQVITSEKEKAPATVTDVITVSQLDSLMKNTVSVTDVIKGGKSSSHPVVTVELDPNSAASQALFGCEPQEKQGVGKVEPTPRIPGMPTVKRSATLAETDTKSEESSLSAIGSVPSNSLAANQKAPEAPKSSDTKSPPSREPSIAKPAASDPSTLPFRNINDTDWKLFRTVPDVAVLDEFDEPAWKKYSIILGSFRQLSNANFVKRTFNGLGERTFVLKKANDLYYVIVASYDSEIDVVAKLDDFTRKYTTNLSKSRRISRYGIPLDDLWILVR